LEAEDGLEYRRHPPGLSQFGPVTSAALVALSSAFDDQVLRFAGTIFLPLARCYAVLLKEDGFDPDLFIDIVAGASQKEWVQEIHLEKATSGAHLASAGEVVFTRAYREAAADALHPGLSLRPHDLLRRASSIRRGQARPQGRPSEPQDRQDGHQGPARGWPIYTLTLEERATCPRTCGLGFCYGNHASRRAHRRRRRARAALWDELEALQAEHPAGFMVRLHILGDFYSAGYVAMWRRALAAFPALHVFGFTARDRDDDEIGRAVFDLAMEDWDRFAIRFSGATGPLWASRIGDDDQAIACPAQTGKTECCGTCTLCWASQRSISFARH
jgi:hypothetical protein